MLSGYGRRNTRHNVPQSIYSLRGLVHLGSTRSRVLGCGTWVCGGFEIGRMDVMKTPEEVIDVALGEHQKVALAGNRDYVRGSDVTAALDAAGYIIVDAQFTELFDRLLHQEPIVNGRIVLEGPALQTFLRMADIYHGRSPNAKKPPQPEG